MPKKYEDTGVSAASLGGGDKCGWLMKQGGNVKTWKHRYFILKNRSLYYYKNPRDTSFKGRVDLDASSSVSEGPLAQSEHAFQVNTSRRVYPLFSKGGVPQQDKKEWMDAINLAIKRPEGAPSSPNPSVGSGSAARAPPTTTPVAPPPDNNQGGVRKRLEDAKQAISFLAADKQSKVFEFWTIWFDSIPPKSELIPGGTIEFFVACSADMQKVTWRTNGPQSIFIQKMVDFFWNVGAPEDEIDRLNDVGALINPVKIGSWIDMSRMGGMDGGWYFPVEVPLRLVIEAADPGSAIREFGAWAEANSVATAFAVGRDMGAAPPRQTEIRFKLPGNTPEDQIKLGLDAFATFKFPPLPDPALSVLRQARVENSQDASVSLSVITSTEGFVRLGLLIPRPSPSDVQALCRAVGAASAALTSFEHSMDISPSTGEGPLFVEYQYLHKPFGYGVYKEGFDIVFHYRVGIEDM